MTNTYYRFLILTIVCTLCVLWFSLPEPVLAQEGYAWVLVEQVDLNGSADVAQQSRSIIYDAQASYAPGNYSITKTYTGDHEPSIENSPEKGETATAHATFENIPEVINPDEAVEIDFSVGFSNRNIINYKGGGGGTRVEAFFCPPDSQPRSGRGDYSNFKDDGGEYSFISGEENGFGTILKKLRAEIHAGEKGERAGLCTRQHFGGISVGTNYVYEWKSLSKKGGGVNSSPQGKFEVPKDENGDYIDSGIRISEVAGEVLVRHGDDPLGWEMVYEDTILYEGDIVYTADGDAGCILSIGDMTTFEMSGETAIVMSQYAEKESKTKVLAGRVIANVKKMIKDGSMSVEMAQAVAGIKGTILVCETDNDTSTVKVLEGSVEVTGNDGGIETIVAGQKISAVGGSLNLVEDFSVEGELDTWSENTRDTIKSAILERTGENVGVSEAEENSPKSHLLAYVLGGLILLVLGAVAFKHK